MFTAFKEFGVRPKFINIPAPLAKITASIVGYYKIFKKKTPLITKFSVWQIVQIIVFVLIN